jgi:hypothetical protein
MKYFVLGSVFFAMQACATVLDHGRNHCKDPEEYWGQEWVNNYSKDLSSLPLDELRRMREKMGAKYTVVEIERMKYCSNPKAKEMGEKHAGFLVKLDQAYQAAEIKQEQVRAANLKQIEADEAAAMEAQEREKQAVCDKVGKVIRKKGLKTECGLTVNDIITGLLRNFASVKDVKNAVGDIGNRESAWTAFQAFPDRALFMSDSGVVLLVKRQGILESQKLSDLGCFVAEMKCFLAFDGVTTYQTNFGSKQAFVFRVVE